MSVGAFAIVLFAAFLHATWNAVVKSGGDTMMTTVLVTGSAALMAVFALPFLPAPASASWPFLAASSVLQIGYFILLARTYRVADMSQTYPVMRGTAPLLVAISSEVVLREALSVPAIMGIAMLCIGVLSMAVERRSGHGDGLILALLNSVLIASYTLIDGAGVRRSGAPAAYALWLFLLAGIPLLLWAVVRRPKDFRRHIAERWHLGILCGFGTVGSYGLALWAMTAAPVAVVAALRETSILFGTAIAALILKERVSCARIAATCVIALGAVVLRLA